MAVIRWSGAEARAAVAAPDLDRRVGVVHDVPAVVVDLGDDDGADIAEALTALPAVAIGCGDNPAGGWDVATTDPGPALNGVRAAPQASVVTAQVLRRTENVAPSDGLVIESLAYSTLQAGPEFAFWLAGRGTRTRNDDAPRVRVVDGDDGAAVITLARPRLRNLLDARMRDELVECLRALALHPNRRIRLVGEGPAFCAGGDPAEFGTVSDPTAAHLIRSTANIAPWLLPIAARAEAVVHGPCVGAGVELAACCGRVVARADARFRLPETRMGLMPGAGGTVSIPARIGRQRTLEWLLCDTEIDAGTALAWGLVDEVVD